MLITFPERLSNGRFQMSKQSIKASMISCPILWESPCPSAAAKTHPFANTIDEISRKSSGVWFLLTIENEREKEPPEVLLVRIVKETILDPMFLLIIQPRHISFNFLESASGLPDFEAKKP